MRKVLKFTVIFVFVCAVFYLGINIYVVKSTNQYIIDESFLETTDAVIVLGAYVFPSGNPSNMLKDRLTCGLKIYEEGITNRILVSGDHGRKNYDEVRGMKNYLLIKEVQNEHIFMDHAGFSTYDSMVRAKKIFGIESIVVSTQKYHLYRALYIARNSGIEAYGIEADLHIYPRMNYYKLRESAARVKDFFFVLFNKRPVFLGEEIDIKGSGLQTED